MQYGTVNLPDVGGRIRLVREAEGFSQSKMAAMLGVSERAYKSYEGGYREVPLAIVEGVCSKLNVSSEWLIWGKGERRRATDRQLLIEIATAIYRSLTDGDLTLSDEQFQHFIEVVLQNCLRAETEVDEEVSRILPLLKGRS